MFQSETLSFPKFQKQQYLWGLLPPPFFVALKSSESCIFVRQGEAKYQFCKNLKFWNLKIFLTIWSNVLQIYGLYFYPFVICQQAGAELCQAQLQLGLDFDYIVCIFGFSIFDLVELVWWTLYFRHD